MLVAAFFIVGACLAYTYQEFLIPLLLKPLGGETLVYLNPAGGFSFIFLISIYAGIALAFPILIQQIYSFLRPALPTGAQKKSPVIIISSFLLLIAGIVFGYMIAVPNALSFLYGFADQYVEASLTAESYLNFIIAYTIGIGVVFQVPLLLLLVNSIKPLTPGGLLKSEKWVVLLSFIVAAIITPTPDPVNQVIIAGPVIVVYQIGVIAVLISIARRKGNTKKQVKAAIRSKIPLETAIEHNPNPRHIPTHEMPFVATPESHAYLSPELARDLDVEIETALAEKARVELSKGHLQSIELDFEEEASATTLHTVELTQEQETELEQALVAAADTDLNDTTIEAQEELKAQEIISHVAAHNFEPAFTTTTRISPAVLPAQPENTQASSAQQPAHRPIDGFGTRRPAANLRAPLRPNGTPITPKATARVRNTTPPRGLYIDGFISSRNAAA